MFLGWPSTKWLFFVPVGYSIWLPGPIICSDWLKFQRSSSLKLMNWLNPNCKGRIIGMSFTKLLFFMPIGNPRWPPSQDIEIRAYYWPWQPYWISDWNEKQSFCRGPSKEHSCYVRFQSAKWFRRRSLKCEKFTDDGRQVMAIVHLDLWSMWTKKLIIMLIQFKFGHFLA
jgi:hypothetical protein